MEIKNRVIKTELVKWRDLEWLQPDWIIDCNLQKFIDRRLLQCKRKEKLQFDIKQIDRKSWKNFSKYHYLSDKLPGGFNIFYGLFDGQNQIGFQCFSNYVPFKKNMKQKIMHFNRTVIHPDYQGYGLGIELINKTSEFVANLNYKVMAKFSHMAVHKGLLKNSKWRFIKESLNTEKNFRAPGGNMQRKNSKNVLSGFRIFVKTYHYEYIG